MSRMSKVVKEEALAKKEKKVVNFMGGYSYELNPIDTLKMITASSIFGEPQYYRNGEFAEKSMPDFYYELDPEFKTYSVLEDDKYFNMKTSEIMEKVIDEGLDYDFGAVLNWAVELRKNYLMRLNPQVIMVRAAMHPKKEEFVKNNPGEFDRINQIVMSRADEPISQFTYFLYRNKSHKNLPNLLKRSWAKKIASLSPYAFNKYKNAGIGMKDIICICHPKSEVVDEFMKTGKVKVEEEDMTWEILKSKGKTWDEILKTIKMNHMALLRNLRGIFTEINDKEICQNVLKELKAGVKDGKQFPFRYWSALKALQDDKEVNHKTLICDALEECMDIACENMPTLQGKTMCLTDNSGSAWGTFNSEYGTITVAEIDNLSSVIVARNCEEGYVGKFGDKLIEYPISKRNGVLIQAQNINNGHGDDVGRATENGIWLFLDRAIKNKEHWDNIFVFSDMQAGHGGLYGLDVTDYKDYICRKRYIDVNKLISKYRSEVNPKVNVFMVQTAGYTNVLVPEYGYRCNLLYGWTGKELIFADTMIKFWDDKDSNKNLNK